MGEGEVQKFARLYLLPGGDHCGGGEGPFNVNLLSAIVAWVETRTEPFAVVASHHQEDSSGSIAGVPSGPPPGVRPGIMPAPSMTGAPPQGAPPIAGDHDGAPPTKASRSKVDRTRPVYPYPITAKYEGVGSIDDAKNFTAGPPAPAAPAQLQWLGSSFYSAHYELWCRGKGVLMNCKSNP